VHSDGRIWSRALWEILLALGHEKADTLILESVFSYAPDSDMPSAALEVIDAAERLYGRRTAKTVRQIFQSRGILP
jgi:Zn-dependent metalloprotease